ncbi:MAG: pyrroline-5-carboxylate reductase [Marinobacterium sp.]|nr:pyrroline-5-carboxylate reductase [Marinobacterium sp.]
MTDYPTLAFIGAGNMARAIIGGLLANGYPAEQIWACEPDASRLEDLTALGLKTSTNNNQAVLAADVVILAVKPQIMKAVLEPLTESVQQKQPLIVSVAAGIPAESLERWLGGNVAIVRCMPNTPALVQQGASGLVANNRVTDTQRVQAEQVMTATGIALWVNSEAELDAVTAVSGSGPAYYFLVMEAMIEAGMKLGLSEEVATQLTLQTARGAATMAFDSEHPPAELRRRVTSPNGTTERAINSYENAGLRQVFMDGMQACSDRSVEMATELGKD